ncbi:MAG: hypothetical protein ACOC44_20675 [Promethearchaeia archaeon]
MNNNHAILSISQSILLLNELYLDAKTSFIIKDCLYGLDLMEIDISDQIRVNLWKNPTDIENAHNQIMPKYADEFPDKYDYFNVFVGAGFFFEPYYRKFFEPYFDELKNIDLLGGDLPVAIAFDTNMYLNLFFNQFSESLRKQYGPAPFPINFLCSNGVKKELTRYEWKYKPNDLEGIREVCKEPDIIDNFFNQNKLGSRLWHLGHVDYLDSIDLTHSKIVNIDKSIQTNDMDSKIIEGLVNNISQQNIKLYLYSQDSDFISRAKGNRNLSPIYLDKIPLYKLNEQFSCEWEQFAKLLSILSVTFGAVKLKFGDSTLNVYGIWKGKKYGDWLNKSVKIVSKNNIIKNIQRDLRILEVIKFKEV